MRDCGGKDGEQQTGGGEAPTNSPPFPKVLKTHTKHLKTCAWNHDPSSLCARGDVITIPLAQKAYNKRTE